MDYFESLKDSTCPPCDDLDAPILAIVSLPTMAEAAEHLSELSPEDQESNCLTSPAPATSSSSGISMKRMTRPLGGLCAIPGGGCDSHAEVRAPFGGRHPCPGLPVVSRWRLPRDHRAPCGDETPHP